MQSTTEGLEWSKHRSELLYIVNTDALHNNSYSSAFLL